MAQQAKSYDIPKFKEQYNNFISGEFVAPKGGEYFDVISPVDGKVFTRVAGSTFFVSGIYSFKNSYS